MTDTGVLPGSGPCLTTRLDQRFWWLVAVALVLAGTALGVEGGRAALWCLTAAATVLALALLSRLRSLWLRRKDRALHRVLSDFLAADSVASFVSDADGALVTVNAAAKQRFGPGRPETLAGVLRDTIANPAALLYRLQDQAAATGTATEDVVCRSGRMRISVRRIGHASYVWRIGEQDDPVATREAIPLAMVTVGRHNTILSMNEAARALVGGRVKALDQLVTSLPVRPGEINEISTRAGPMSCVVAERASHDARRELFLLPNDTGEIVPGQGSLDYLPVPLVKLEPDGTIQLSNRPARRLLGLSEGEAARLTDLVEGLGRSIADWLTDAAEGRGLNRSEVLRLSKPEKDVFLQVMLNRISENGQPALIAVLTDATELKTLEAQFVQSQKMQAIGQLAGGVAHDFNNLLTAISGHCDLLLLRHDRDDPDYGDLMQINQNANRAAALVGQLLAFSRKQTLRLEVTDLRDTLADLTHLLNRLVGEKVTLKLRHDPELKPIRADKRQLEQVLMNLVVNARDAMPEGGEIVIDTEARDIAEPLQRDRATIPPGDYVSVTVTDQGMGIPAAKLHKVFEPFYTTKRTGEGTGLGLSTAYGIVKQTGGFIFVDSQPGHGTCFTLLFPAVDAVPDTVRMQDAPTERGPSSTPRDGVVLLVEDEAPVRAFAARALRMRGLTVIEADSAEAALDLLSDAGMAVDVFVTDVVMPGMDGPSWVRRALEDRPGTRVVFVSGYAEDALDSAQADIPHSVFLPKPFSLSDLTETVQRQLH